MIRNLLELIRHIYQNNLNQYEKDQVEFKLQAIMRKKDIHKYLNE